MLFDFFILIQLTFNQIMASYFKVTVSRNTKAVENYYFTTHLKLFAFFFQQQNTDWATFTFIGVSEYFDHHLG